MLNNFTWDSMVLLQNCKYSVAEYLFIYSVESDESCPTHCFICVHSVDGVVWYPQTVCDLAR